jgi:uncharacterized protein (TIGR03437 family)
MGGGSLPPGISLGPSGVLTGTPTTPGAYNFTTRLAISVSAEGQRVDFNINLVSDMRVSPSTAPQAAVEPRGVFFPFAEGSQSAAQVITVSNRSSQPASFTASATVFSAGNWLSVSPASGAVAPFGAAAVTATVNPSGLAAGTYSGRITVAVSPGGPFDLPVTVTVSSSPQSIVLSQTGLIFRTAVGGAVPPQSFNVLTDGSGSLNWTTSTATISGGSGWLSTAPASGTSTASAGRAVQVTVNPAGLAAGDYYGQVDVSAAGVANSPQTVSVVLNLQAAGAVVAPVVTPTGIIFVGAPGGTNPPSQFVSITNTTTRPITFNAGTFFEQGRSFFTLRSTGGTVQPGSPARIELVPALTGLATGIYRGELTVRLVGDGSVRRITVLLVVAPGAGVRAGLPLVSQAACTPTRLLPVFTLLGADFKVTAGWPTPLEVLVVDDCGQLFNTGSVVASFSNSDPPVVLLPLGEGRWAGTWPTRDPNASRVTISVRARRQNLEGVAEVGGSVETNASIPIISAGAVVSAASFAQQAPLAPGSIISIFGSRMAQATNVSPALPLATQLAGTRAALGGRLLPLLFASDGQINAVIPYDTPVNTRHPLVVQRGNALSTPEAVTIAPAQPAVFTRDQSGRGQGIIIGAASDGRQFLAAPGSPVAAGDVLVIYCAGLGAVDPPVMTGTGAPSSPLARTTNVVTVTVGGRPADVLFSGLAPGFAGLYQVNAVMPSGVAAGDAVPVVLTSAGQSSPPVTIAVR